MKKITNILWESFGVLGNEWKLNYKYQNLVGRGPYKKVKSAILEIDTNILNILKYISHWKI